MSNPPASRKALKPNLVTDPKSAPSISTPRPPTRALAAPKPLPHLVAVKNLPTSPLDLLVNAAVGRRKRVVVQPPPKRSQNEVTFPLQLYSLISSTPDHIIHWTGGGRAFRVLNQTALEQHMSKYFRHSKYGSLQRQLNMYGFRKHVRGELCGSFVHPVFREGMTDFTEVVNERKEKQEKKNNATLDPLPAPHPPPLRRSLSAPLPDPNGSNVKRLKKRASPTRVVSEPAVNTTATSSFHLTSLQADVNQSPHQTRHAKKPQLHVQPPSSSSSYSVITTSSSFESISPPSTSPDNLSEDFEGDATKKVGKARFNIA